MAAPKGNQFWLARSTHGRKPIFETPEALLNACLEYFKWAEDNPLWEEKAFNCAGKIKKTLMYKMRAMTMDGLTIFLDISDECWYNYKKRKEYVGVVTYVEKAMRHQKFSGAAADLLNPNIIARDLGLVDKKQVDVNDVTEYSDEELEHRAAERIKALGLDRIK